MSVVVDNEDLTLGEMLNRSSSNRRRPGAIMIVDFQGKLIGLLTDSDIRRLLTAGSSEVLEIRVRDVMTRDPIAIDEDEILLRAIELVKMHRVDEIPIVDKFSRPVGLLDVQDILSLSMLY
jgi:arabinose-5-phosphate isomerase